MAGRSTPEASAQRVGSWFSPDRLLWGYADEIWDLYGIPYQPVSVAITGDDIEVGRWFGEIPEDELRDALDRLAAYG